MIKKEDIDYLSNLEIACVFWEDASQDHDVYPSKEDLSLLPGLSCGIVLFEDDTKITITRDYFFEVINASARSRISIPKSCIFFIKKMKLSKFSKVAK